MAAVTTIWADKHRIRRCDSATGHAVVTIAHCENSTIAKFLVEALSEKIARDGDDFIRNQPAER